MADILFILAVVYHAKCMLTILALSNSDIIGLIIAIALVALTIAVCFYLLSKKDKKN